MIVSITTLLAVPTVQGNFLVNGSAFQRKTSLEKETVKVFMYVIYLLILYLVCFSLGA